MLTLNVSKRTAGSTPDIIRAKGFVPAVFYGKKDASTAIEVKEVDLIKIWKQAGESSVVTLKDESGSHDSLIHEVQRDAVSGRIIHADFYILEKGKKVTVKVPLVFEGVSMAIKALGGTLVKVAHELEIEAQPADLPHDLPVDISILETFDNQIHARDIKLPKGVTLVGGEDEVIALATPPREEKEEAPAEIDLSKIEVEKKGKKDEEGAEAEASK